MDDIETLLKAKIPCPETGIEVKRTICDICCPCTHCGIDAYVKDGRVIKVEGTKEHPRNKGKLCAKGHASRQYIYRADRLRTPLRRIGARGEGKFEPISWDEAYAEIARRLNGIKAADGADSVAFFSGYTKWYRQFLHRFAYSFGSINYGSECSTCYKSAVMAWEATAGLYAAGPDMGNSNVLLGWALNPYYSKHLALPRLQAFKDRGGKIIIIDPRKTPATAKLADMHLQLKAGTDGALALGMAKLIIDNGWADMDYIQKYTHGFEAYKEYVSQFDLERVSRITGLNPHDIFEATRIYATSGPACIQESSAPLAHQINGFQNYRAMICLNALTGNFDRVGGCLPETITYYDQSAGYLTHEHEYYRCREPKSSHPRIGQDRFPLWSKLVDEFQAMDLLRQITEGKPYPIKAVFACGMNAKMFPNTRKFYQALQSLDFFVDVDLFMTDTAKYADIVLPACTSFERGEFKAYPGGFAQFTNPVIQPLYESKNDVQILSELAAVMDLDDDLLRQGYEAGIAFMLRDLDITIDQMKASDLPIHVPDAHPDVAGELLKNGFPTPSGKFEFWSEAVAEFSASHGLDPLPTYRDPFDDCIGTPEEYPLKLITGARLPNAIHSRLHEVPWLRSLRPEPTADLSLEDAGELGISQDDWMEITTPTGSVRVKAHSSSKIQPGEVHLYHGYREANANDLVSEEHLDPYSGFPGYRANRCSVRKVEPVS